MSSDATMNPNGRVASRRVMEDRPLELVSVECVVTKDNVLQEGGFETRPYGKQRGSRYGWYYYRGVSRVCP